jgi:putative oxidoreductase
VKYAVLAGRQLFSMIFIISSAAHFTPLAIASATSHHVPLPHILVPLSGLMAFAGGLSVLLGFQTRFGAWLLVSFLVPVTLMMHNFWAVPDPAISQFEKAMFVKNIAMLGGALLISYFGAGPLSLDALMKPVSHDREEVGTSTTSTRSALGATADRPMLRQGQSRRVYPAER